MYKDEIEYQNRVKYYNTMDRNYLNFSSIAKSGTQLGKKDEIEYQNRVKYYNTMDRIYLNFSSIAKSGTQLGKKDDAYLIKSIQNDIKYVMARGCEWDVIKTYIDVIFSGHPKVIKKLIVVQMFNYFRQSCYCKYHVSGSLFYVK